MRVLLVTTDGDDSILRQTPGRTGRWRDCDFVVDPRRGPFHLIAVMEDTPFTIDTQAARTLWFPCEPPRMRRHPIGFLRQFDAICSMQPRSWRRPVIARDFCYNWHIGCQRNSGSVQYPLGYDEMQSHVPPAMKNKILSCVASAKALIPGHVRRLRFAQAVQRQLGASCDLFGAGINPVADKADAIVPYRLHLTIENEAFPGYWSEKLGDAFLGEALPIYCGDPQITRCFPTASLLTIDIRRPNAALEQVCAWATDSEHLYTERRSAILEAKSLILGHLNVFDACVDALEQIKASGMRQRCIRPREACATRLDRAKTLALRGRRKIEQVLTKTIYHA